jgi:CheY-like chemotaxis protein
MDEQTQQRIFEPFFTTKERGKGTGLGLATVYGIVSQSRGEIHATSRPGQGSLFEIRLPATVEALPAEEPPKAASRPVQARTILLVEDEEGVRNLFSDVLGNSGYRVLAAADPDAALALGMDEGLRIDLLLTDVVMPRMSGKQLAQRLEDLRPGLRVVFMSGYTDHILESEAGDWDFIQKPCSLEALQRKVREVLSR